MERKQFKITCDESSIQEKIKYSWNSSRQETRKMLRTICNREDTYFSLVNEEITKGAFGSEENTFIRSEQFWASPDGLEVNFIIERIK